MVAIVMMLKHLRIEVHKPPSLWNYQLHFEAAHFIGRMTEEKWEPGDECVNCDMGLHALGCPESRNFLRKGMEDDED